MMNRNEWLSKSIYNNRWKLLLWILFALLLAVTKPLASFYLSRVVEALDIGASGMIIATILAFFTIRLWIQMGSVYADYYRKKSQLCMIGSGRKELYNYLQSRRLEEIMKWTSGKLMDIYRIADEYLSGLFEPYVVLGGTLITLLLSVWILFSANRLLCLISVLCCLGWYCVTALINIIVKKKESRNEANNSTLYQTVTYLFDHLEAILTLHNKDMVLKEYKYATENLQISQKALDSWMSAKDDLVNTVFVEGFRIILIVLALWNNDNVHIAEILLYYYLVECVFDSAFALGEIRQMFIRLNVRKQMISQIFEIQGPDIGRKEFNEEAEPLIILRNVNITLGDTRIIKNMNCEIKRNKVTLIYGNSGQGKTTLVRCLLGIYHPDSGEIYNGSTSYTELNTDSIPEHFAVFVQNGKLFSMSIRENLALSGNDTEVDEILERLNLRDLLEREVTDKSNNTDMKLSGGEIQRVRLARTLLAQKKLFIFDEPTSQLDAENESRVCELIHELKNKGCTIILISHREALRKLADEIVSL